INVQKPTDRLKRNACLASAIGNGPPPVHKYRNCQGLIYLPLFQIAINFRKKVVFLYVYGAGMANSPIVPANASGIKPTNSITEPSQKLQRQVYRCDELAE